jgi:hypothetical protein
MKQRSARPRQLAAVLAIVLMGTLACDKSPTTPLVSNPASSGFAPTSSKTTTMETGELSVTVTAEAPPYPGTGDYVYTASVSGGSGSYIYKWFQRGCNVQDNAIWCMPNHTPWGSGEGLTSVTIWRGPYDTQVQVVVEVQESSGDDPASGVGLAVSYGPNEAYFNPTYAPGSGSMDPCSPRLNFLPLSRRVGDVWQDYGRNQCNGEIFTEL